MTLRPSIVSVALTLFVAACGGSSTPSGTENPPAGQSVVVVTAPSELDIGPGETALMSAQVTGTADTSVVWTVAEADGGSVDATGLYTAPAIEGTFHVRAESATPAKSAGTSVVRVKKTPPGKLVDVSVLPPAVTVAPGSTTTFLASVSGSAVASVTWTVQEASGCGSVSSAGVYTAPDAAATCHVVATSTSDATRSAVAAVTVSAVPVISVAVAPTSTSTTTGGTVAFSATVTGTSAGQSTAVTWSVPAGAGTINASGVYVAPATAGTYLVTAASVAVPAKTATATVVVSAPPPPPPPPPPAVAVTISPSSITLDACKGQVFTATVTNSSNGAVTWRVTEGSAGGSLAGNGIYTAPQAAGTYHVVATSVADPTKTAQGTITVGAEKVLSVAVSPASGSIPARGSLALAATVTTTCGTFAAQ